MTNEFPKISDAEWQVIKVLWEKSPLTSTEIIEKLKFETKWNPKTIHTLIGRLVKKNAIGVEKGQSFNQYYPLVSEKDCIRVEMKSFIQKAYDGSLKMLLTNFIRDEKLSKEEIEELKRILDNKEE